MRKTLFTAATLIVALGTPLAQAQTTVIERDKPDTVVVDRPATESKTVTTHDHGDGCSSKTVSKENEVGDRKTVTKESCD